MSDILAERVMCISEAAYCEAGSEEQEESKLSNVKCAKCRTSTPQRPLTQSLQFEHCSTKMLCEGICARNTVRVSRRD